MEVNLVDATYSLRELAEALANDPSMAAVVQSLQSGNSGTIDGAWGSSKSLAVAALAMSSPHVLVVVLPHFSEIDSFAEDLRTFGQKLNVVFPPLEDYGRQPSADMIRKDPSWGQRLSVLKTLTGEDPPRLILTTIQALLAPVPLPDDILRNSLRLIQGDLQSMDDVVRWLGKHGWTRTEAVELPGEFSVRGGILDVFAYDAENPLRIEFFGDEIDSIRSFSVETQRSLRELKSAVLTAVIGDSDKLSSTRTAHFAEYLPKDSWFVLAEPTELRDEATQYLQRLADKRGLFTVEGCWNTLLKFPTVTLSSFPVSTVETVCRLQTESVERFSGEATKLCAEIDRTITSDRLVIACHNKAETKRLSELLGDSTVAREGRLSLIVGHLRFGFRWVTAGVVCLSDHELFQRADVRRVSSRRYQGRAIDSFVELRVGDYVVHLGHGIGIFRGMKMLEKSGQLEEHLTVEFADQLLVYVPASRIHLIQKYVGTSQAAPRLSKIGGLTWERRKRAVERAVADLAGDLIEVQAARQAQPGLQYPPDSEWLKEFEAAFPYLDTPDQAAAWREIRNDMQSTKPMDRLICGDVGYGKTELAMRAAFKAVDFGKQVAVLVPTTVLAQQHLRTFRERMAEFPFVIEALSRFETKKQQKEIIESAATGGVDILIGTHRLLSPDVHFHDLGLVIVDEEQRFGVVHKEKLKLLRSQVDVLTLTATPIPRTLHSALLGIRDISNLETPPHDRLAVETRIIRFDEKLIRHAILRELNRDGQVYFVHNRVQDIGKVARSLERIVPEARIAIVHGQMADHEIEDGMVAFLERRADILLATTIIESGLDIPNANTIFINEGDRYGLADLHQLRGRVGRSKNRAYCYVVVDDHKLVKPDAQRRLKAIEEYSALGSGFQIALRDLEIRGAGNILGAEQSGHIAAVGYELYCQLLENAVRAAKRQPLKTFLDVTVELPWRAYLPQNYLTGERLRIDVYRRLGRVTQLNELDEIRKELEDRFGKPPEPALNFLDLVEIRVLAQHWQIESIRPDEEGHLLMTYRNGRKALALEKLRQQKVKIVDRKTAYIRVAQNEKNARSYAKILKSVLQED